MKPVEFVQFLLPNGEQRIITIELPDEVAAKAAQIKVAGCRLTAEILNNGVCSFAIEEPHVGDFDCALSSNGPGVQEAVTKIITRFDPKAFAEWKAGEQ